MSKKIRKNKGRPGRNPVLPQPVERKPWFAKRGALATGRFFKSCAGRIKTKATQFKQNVKTGAKLVEQSSQAAGAIKNHMDRLDLLKVAEDLRIQAKALEALASTL